MDTDNRDKVSVNTNILPRLFIKDDYIKRKACERLPIRPEENTIIFYITNNGLALARKLSGLYPDARILRFKKGLVSHFWQKGRNLVFIMATGIVVRTIAPLIKSKKTDPAVVVLEEKGRYAISLLSGHLGGANDLARRIAHFLKGEAVITTSSDINDLPSIDLWAEGKGFVIENEEGLPEVATRLIDKGSLNVYSEIDIDLPPHFKKISDLNSADLVITNKDLKFMAREPILILRPKNLVIGIGCNSGTSVHEIGEAVRKVLSEKGLSFHSIHSIATIDRKAEEPGLIEFAKRHGFGISYFAAEELNSVVNLQPSAFSQSRLVFNATGAYGVAEPAALLASVSSELLVPKQKIGNVTIAVAQVGQQNTEKKQGRLYIIGTGPGSIGYIAPRAIEAIRGSEIIVGYTTYIELIKGLIKGKEVISTGMTQEIERAKRAVELALLGRTVSIISGGDPGIYGMAGLVLEILRAEERQSIGTTADKEENNVVEVIPGISALSACASRLGAPLMHDFVCISLSDRLTEWSLIEKRLELAAVGDFVTVLYNPKSKGRQGHINKARDIFLRYRSEDTPVGMVKGAMRSQEEVIITNLKDMLNYNIDMETTVIIGNSQTYVWNNWMITPRGYEKKMHKK